MSIFKYYNENTGQWEPMTVASEIKKATESNLGGVKAKNAVSGDTQEVHIDNNGFLVTKPGGGGGNEVMVVTFTKGAIQDGKTTVTADVTYNEILNAINANISVLGQIKDSGGKKSIFEPTKVNGTTSIFFVRTLENVQGIERISLTKGSNVGTLETVPFPSGGGGTGAVSSVNGRTGAVTLDASDVGAIPETSGVDGQYAVSNGAGGIRFTELPRATGTGYGILNPQAKQDTDVQAVRVDGAGRLWTAKGSGGGSSLNNIVDGPGNSAGFVNSYTAQLGANSFSEGYNTLASGDNSHAEGEETKATGYNSHAEGFMTEASSNHGAHAEGYKTVASASASHAEGSENKAQAINSHVEGNLTVAKTGANNSHVEGFNTIATGENQHVQGKWNKADADKAFIIGAGNAENSRWNIFTVDWNGRVDAQAIFVNNKQVSTISDTQYSINQRVPEPFEADAGKFLRVNSRGFSEWQTVPDANGVSF